MKNAEFEKELKEHGEKLVKIGTETKSLKGKIDLLEKVIADSDNVNPAIVAAFEVVKAQGEAVDLLVDDLPTAPTTDTTAATTDATTTTDPSAATTDATAPTTDTTAATTDATAPTADPSAETTDAVK